MFIFLEGNKKSFPDINLGEDISHKYVTCGDVQTFDEAIKTLSVYKSRNNTSVTFFHNFFKSVQHLSAGQKRGLERIAIGDLAMEIHDGLDCATKFMRATAICRWPDVRELIIHRRIDVTLGAVYKDGIGNFMDSRILIVGDRPGPNSHNLNNPFVGSGSGLWLSNLLDEHNISENKLYWINAKDNDGIETDINIIKELKPLRVIALGNEAFKWVNKAVFLECEIHKVPHPQYWKRFKSKEVYPLISLLQSPVADWNKHPPHSY